MTERQREKYISFEILYFPLFRRNDALICMKESFTEDFYHLGTISQFISFLLTKMYPYRNDFVEGFRLFPWPYYRAYYS